MKIDASLFSFGNGVAETKTVIAVSENNAEEMNASAIDALKANGFTGGGHMWLTGDSITFPPLNSFSFYSKPRKNGSQTSVFATVLNRTQTGHPFDISSLRKSALNPEFFEQYPLMAELYRRMNDYDLFAFVAGKTVRCIGRVKCTLPIFENGKLTDKVNENGSLPIFAIYENKDVPEVGTDWPLPTK
jgi:hypothetical protein